MGFAVAVLGAAALAVPPDVIVGSVRGPVDGLEGACVRRQATSSHTVSDAKGSFTLRGHGKGRITAAKPGFIIAGGLPLDGRLDLRLQPIPTHDHDGYTWVDPRPAAEQPGNCGNCHQEMFQEWSASGHGRAAVNPRFLDLHAAPEGGGAFAWNLKADQPLAVGVCAACHLPTVDPGHEAFDEPRRAAGVASQGVHCDFCHKVMDVSTERLGKEHGRYAMELRRPKKGQLFFGPLDDVDRGEDSFSPLYRQSRYCAGCHEGTVLGTKVYTTYSEWLASPARLRGEQCQDCHMKPTGKMTNIAPGHGGLERDPATLASHRMHGAELLKLRAPIQVRAELGPAAGHWILQVELRAEKVGHRVPTGFVDRHLLLVIDGMDGAKQAVAATTGERLGATAGPGLAGQPGRFFGRLLADGDGRHPVPFWRAATELADTRLHPEQSRRSRWTFPLALKTARVRLIYRPFFEDVRRAKKWPVDDLLLHDETLLVPP